MDVKSFQELLDIGIIDVNQKDQHNRTALHYG